MRVCLLLVVVALSACSIDSTGLLPADSGARADARATDAGRDGALTDAGRDGNVPDIPVPVDVGEDVPLDVPADVPTDTTPDTSMPDAGPDVCAEPGVVACYLFEDNALDSSSNGHDLTAVNLGFVSDGARGSAASFTEATELSLRTAGLGLGAEYTFELWFRKDEPLSDFQGLIDDNTFRLFVFPTGSAARVNVRANFEGQNLSSNNFERDGWHHVVAVSEGRSVRVYVDGVQRSTDRDPMAGERVNLHVGSTTPGENDTFINKFIGEIDQIRVWDRALSDMDVLAMFDAD